MRLPKNPNDWNERHYTRLIELRNKANYEYDAQDVADALGKRHKQLI